MWFFHVYLLLSGCVILCQLVLVFHYFGFVDFSEAVVDWLYKMSAEVESAFA